MLIDFTFSNFRSFKGRTTLSMEANSSNQKISNLSLIENQANQNFRLLKTAVIYGANASGKSNTLRALFEMLNFILNKPDVEEPLRICDPFLFEENAALEPCVFELTFLGPNSIKYDYSFSVMNHKVAEETLNYYPNGKVTKIYSRKITDSNSSTIQSVTLSKLIGGETIKVFENQLLISKFGSDEPHEFLTELYLYFKTFEVINSTSVTHKLFLKKNVDKLLFEDEKLRNQVQKIIKEADTKVLNIDIKKADEEEIKSNYRKGNPFIVRGVHRFISHDYTEGTISIPMKEESTGTQSLYMLAARVMMAINNGSVLIVDELDTSLHPFLTRMLVDLFQSEEINTKNAQLIFTTHDVSLLDKDLLRRDQIWVTEKNNQGYSDLFSLQDFDGLRSDTPFEKWYMAGKFGGLPQVKSVDSFFSND